VLLTLVKDGFTGVVDADKVSFTDVIDTDEKFFSGVVDTGDALENSKSVTYRCH
jgi:hypothetical protein